MKILSYVSLVLFLYGSIPSYSQEVLSGIEVNHSVREHYRQSFRLKSTGTGMLELPFFDDFSRSAIYPDQDKWSDRYVFINNDYPVNPVSIGVATFDAIDHTGALYENASTWPFVADHLTSRPVNLDYNPADSIYLSFFYQPQGKGDKPQSHDSLRLEFYSPGSDAWTLVWSVPGDSLHEFRLVMIPVNDPHYLDQGFRFRFSNLASVADNRFNPGAISNCDHWHIDYVYLDKNRGHADTVFRDIAFVKTLYSLLNNYNSMPWTHFHAGRTAEMASTVPVTIRNNDIVPRSANRHFSIYNVHENRVVHSFSGGSASLGPQQVLEYDQDIAYTFASASSDSALFKIKAWLSTDDNDFKGNDTISLFQVFDNYFALDDGTAENGYGLHGGGTENARIAYRFKTYLTDTLRAVDIYFNQSLNHMSRHYFHLAIWDDNNGRPGNLLYFQEGERPFYENELNRFHTYYLDSPIEVPRVFYVGIIQTTPEFLNIGWDVNNNNKNRIFYNISGEWKNTSFEGSLMIRPFLGGPPKTAVKEQAKNSVIKIYPNPAGNILYIDLDADVERNLVKYRLFNPVGQVVYQGNGFEQSIILSAFPPGVYFLHAEIGKRVETKKILIK